MLVNPLDPTSIVWMAVLYPLSVHYVAGVEYRLLFLSAASSKPVSNGTVSSIRWMAIEFHSTMSGRSSVVASCCGKLYCSSGRSDVIWYLLGRWLDAKADSALRMSSCNGRQCPEDVEVISSVREGSGAAVQDMN